MNATEIIARRAYEHAPPNRRVKTGFQSTLANILHQYGLEAEYWDHERADTVRRIADLDEQVAAGLIPR